MKILVTNDDGIQAEGLKKLALWATKLGEVTVVAPKSQQSGKSHGIEFHRPTQINKVDFEGGITAYSVDSTPADCVRFAINGLKLDVDVVFSGINAGYNMGRDVVYSATVGAIFEADFCHRKGVAFSTSVGIHCDAASELDRVWDYITSNKLLDQCNAINVNIPPNAKDIFITRQGQSCYSDSFFIKEGNLYLQDGQLIFNQENNFELDDNAIMAGHVSITPMTLERTDVNVFEKLKKLNK